MHAGVGTRYAPGTPQEDGTPPGGRNSTRSAQQRRVESPHACVRLVRSATSARRRGGAVTVCSSLPGSVPPLDRPCSILLPRRCFSHWTPRRCTLSCLGFPPECTPGRSYIPCAYSTRVIIINTHKETHTRCVLITESTGSQILTVLSLQEFQRFSFKRHLSNWNQPISSTPPFLTESTSLSKKCHPRA